MKFIIAAIKFGLLIFKLPKCLELKWFLMKVATPEIYLKDLTDSSVCMGP